MPQKRSIDEEQRNMKMRLLVPSQYPMYVLHVYPKERTLSCSYHSQSFAKGSSLTSSCKARLDIVPNLTEKASGYYYDNDLPRSKSTKTKLYVCNVCMYVCNLTLTSIPIFDAHQQFLFGLGTVHAVGRYFTCLS